jgi:hypothetical protein
MTLSAFKSLIITSLDLNTIRQKRDQSPKQQKKKSYPKIYEETIRGDRKTYKEDYSDTPPPRRLIF